MVLYRGSMDDCADPLLGIEHHNIIYAVEVWRSSYVMEVWKGYNVVEAWTIVLIHCLVSITIMTPRTRHEIFLHRGSVERVLSCGSMDDCANTFLGIEHHNDIDAVEAWRSSYNEEVLNRSYIVEAWTIVLIHCLVSITVMTPRAGEEKFLDRGSLERVLQCGSMDDCADPLLGIKHHNDTYVVIAWSHSYTVEVWKWSNIEDACTIVLIHFLVSITIMTPRTREEKFLHHGCVEKVIYRGGMGDCSDPLLGIKHNNDIYAIGV
nr:hypothetical protein CFP56_19868 [Quercus suber]